jgi:hypothetical protein
MVPYSIKMIERRGKRDPAGVFLLGGVSSKSAGMTV